MTREDIERAALLGLPVIALIRSSLKKEEHRVYIIGIRTSYQDGGSTQRVECWDGKSRGIVCILPEDVLRFADEKAQAESEKRGVAVPKKTDEICWINNGRVSQGDDTFRIQAQRGGVVIGDYLGYMDDRHDIMHCYIEKGRITEDLPKRVDLSLTEISRGGNW